MLHRNSQKRFYNPEFTYFVTVKAQGNYPYFADEGEKEFTIDSDRGNSRLLCELWIEELKLCKELKKFEIFAFCLLKDHFHMVIRCTEEVNISEVLRSFKTNFSRNANVVLGYNDILKARSRDLAFKMVEHLQYVDSLRQKFLKNNQIQNSAEDRVKFQWQQSFHDHVIRNEADFYHHLQYTAYNFTKHEYPENWEWTSLHFPEILDEL